MNNRSMMSANNGPPSTRRGSSSDGAFKQTVVSNGFIVLANVGTGLLAARLLGPAGRGQLAAAMNLQVTLGTLAALGMPDAIVYFTARYKSVSVGHLRSAFVPVILAGSLAGAVGYISAPLLLASQTPNTVRLAQLYALTVPLEALWALPDRALRGSGQFGKWNLLRPVPVVLWIGCLVFAGTTGELRAQGLLLLYFVTRAVTLVPYLFYVLRSDSGSVSPRKGTTRRMLRFGLPSTLNSVPFIFNSKLDQVLLGALLPARDLGIYVVAVAWAGFSNTAALAVSGLLFPKVAGITDSKRREELFAYGARMGLLLSLALSILLAPLTPFAIPLLLGDGYRDAVVIGMILLVANVFSGLNIVLEEGARGLGKPALVLRAELIGLVVLIPLLLVSLPTIGLVGAGLSAIVGYAAISVVLVFSLSQTCSNLVGAWVVPTRRESIAAARRVVGRAQPVQQDGSHF